MRAVNGDDGAFDGRIGAYELLPHTVYNWMAPGGQRTWWMHGGSP